MTLLSKPRSLTEAHQQADQAFRIWLWVFGVWLLVFVIWLVVVSLTMAGVVA